MDDEVIPTPRTDSAITKWCEWAKHPEGWNGTPPQTLDVVAHALERELVVAERDAELARSISEFLGLGREIKEWRAVTLALDKIVQERDAALKELDGIKTTLGDIWSVVKEREFEALSPEEQIADLEARGIDIKGLIAKVDVMIQEAFARAKEEKNNG